MAFACIKHCPLNHLIPPNPRHPTCHCLCHPTIHNKHPSHYKHEYNPPTFLERCGHIFRMDNPHPPDNIFLRGYPDHLKEHPHILEHRSPTLPTPCMCREILVQMSKQRGSFGQQNLYGFNWQDTHVWVVHYVYDSH